MKYHICSPGKHKPWCTDYGSPKPSEVEDHDRLVRFSVGGRLLSRDLPVCETCAIRFMETLETLLLNLDQQFYSYDLDKIETTVHK